MTVTAAQGTGVQVAQLGEQQVQGCTTRITHVESDLVRRMDHIKQQQDTQAMSQSDTTAHIAHLQSQLWDLHDSPSSSQSNTSLTELRARMDKLQMSLDANTAEHADPQLEAGLVALKAEVELLQSKQASQDSAARRLASLEHDMGLVRTELDQLSTAHAAQQSTGTSMLQIERDLSALHDELHQLQEGRVSQDSVGTSRLEQELAAIKAELRQFQSSQAAQHSADTSLAKLEQTIAAVKTEMIQLHDHQAAQDSASEMHSNLKQDVAALKTELNQLTTIQHSDDRWHEETHQLKCELATCHKAESDTEAAVLKLSTQLSSLEMQLMDLQAEKCAAAEHAGGPSSQVKIAVYTPS